MPAQIQRRPRLTGRAWAGARLLGPLGEPFARNLFGGHVDAVEDVHVGDPQDQRGKRLLVVVLDGFVPDLVRYGVGEVRGIPPGDQGEESLVRLATFSGFGRGAN